jgi:hypothetical protein
LWPAQHSPLVAGELTLLWGTEGTTVDAGLSDPPGQAAVGESQPLRNSRAGELFPEAEGTASAFCCAMNRCVVLVALVIDRQSEGYGATPIDLSTKLGQPQSFGEVIYGLVQP